MNLEEKIMEGIKTAMKSKDKEKLEALRAVKSAILLAKTEKGGQPLLDEKAETALLQKLVKQRKESADIFLQQNRKELYEKEMQEAEIIASFLPEQWPDDRLESELKSIIAETGATGMSDMGKVMGIATKKLAGRADGKRISTMVRKLLGA